jgi:ATP-dependent Clp protease ATP-binding subunit ClpA
LQAFMKYHPKQAELRGSSPDLRGRDLRAPGIARPDIAALLSRKLVGQPAAIEAIVPSVEVFRARLSPEGRPAGNFLLLGPTGTGKTRTVEALADVLHGSAKKLLRIDCGEFQMDHEVAKLVGAPPGYLGHRETQPVLTQQKLNAAASESCDLSLLLLDEIEKAAPSMTRLLLGILDKGALRLGDGTAVNFEKTMVFLTSNLGASEMSKHLRPDFGFDPMTPKSEKRARLAAVGAHALRRNFPPEFINRIDEVITYQPLSAEALAAILDLQIRDFQDHIQRRLGLEAFHLNVPARTRRFLLQKGTSEEYGARELKRTIQRHLIHPLAALVAAGDIDPGAHVRADVDARRDKLVLRGDQSAVSAC